MRLRTLFSYKDIVQRATLFWESVFLDCVCLVFWLLVMHHSGRESTIGGVPLAMHWNLFESVFFLRLF